MSAPSARAAPRPTGAWPTQRGGRLSLLSLWSDDRLVALATTGDRRATRTIYERYRLGVLRYNRCLLRSGEDASDALTELFARAFGALRDGARPQPLRAWLYRLAHDECSARLRARRPRLVVGDGDRVLIAARRADGDRLGALLDDIGRLPHDHRAGLLLHELDGFAADEIAAILGVSTPSARSAVLHARWALHAGPEPAHRGCEGVHEDLDDRRPSALAAHMVRCRGCRAFRAGLRERAKLLRGLGPDAPPGPLAGFGARRARVKPRTAALDVCPVRFPN